MTDVREAVKLQIEANLGKAFEGCPSPTDVCERGNCWCNVLVEELADAVFAALNAVGWQCVPKIATGHMLLAGREAQRDAPADVAMMMLWEAMLAAAPKVKP